MNEIFSIFNNKSINSINESDLQILCKNEVKEGWFVEYKSAFEKSDKTSKSISSFANCKGGWYCVGVQEGDCGYPEQIHGFDIKLKPNPIEFVRESIREHISPIPFYDSRLIKLASGKYVLLVYVYESTEPPCFHSDGRIYIRVGEGKHPVVEKDSHEIMKLYKKRQKYDKFFDVFCTNAQQMSVEQSERNQSAVEIYCMARPNSLNFPDFYSKEFVESINLHFKSSFSLFKQASIYASPNAGSMTTSYNSITLRCNFSNENIYDLSSTIEIFRTGHCKINLFMPEFTAKSIYEIYKSSDIFGVFLSKIPKESDEYIKFIDYYALIFMMSPVLNAYSHLLLNYGYRDRLKLRIMMKNMWRSCLYIDHTAYLDHIDTFGLPLIHKGCLEIPGSETDEDLFTSIADLANFVIYGAILQGLGVPRHKAIDFSDGIANQIEYYKNRTFIDH